MKRIEGYIEDNEHVEFEKASKEEGRSMRLQVSWLIRKFLKERGQKKNK